MDVQEVKKRAKSTKKYMVSMLKWVLLASITGFICGGIGTLFHFAVAEATLVRQEQGWLLYLLPVAGIVIVFLYRICGLGRDGGTNLIIDSIRSSERIPLRMTPLIFMGTVLTHLCGGSSGREGAALQIGGSLGAVIGRVTKLNDNDMHIITMCGMSALFSALFGTPLTATIFSMEVISVGVIYYAAFLPCVISAIIANEIAGLCGIAPTSFGTIPIPDFSIITCLKVGALAVLCAGCSILFVICMHEVHKLFQRYIANPYARILLGAVLVIGLTFLVGTRDYNGAGMDVIQRAMDGEAVPLAFLLKILFTAITLGVGFKGGEIVPTFFIGSTFGCVMGSVVGLNPGFGAALGLISLFCAVVNCPFTSMILSVELFGSVGILFFALSCAISYMLSGYYSLYSSQKIVYSKLQAQYINAKTK